MKSVVKVKINEEIRRAVLELFETQAQTAMMDEVAASLLNFEAKITLNNNKRVLKIVDGSTTGTMNCVVISHWRVLDIKRLNNLLNALLRELREVRENE